MGKRIRISLIDEINKHIADQESKFVFSQRMMYSLSGDFYYLNCLGNKFRESLLVSDRWKLYTEFLEGKSSFGSLIIYGAQGYGRMTVKCTPGISWDYIIDRNMQSEGIDGITVISIQDVRSKTEVKTTSVVIPSKRYIEEMRESLCSIGVPEENIIDGTLIWELTEGRQYFDLAELVPDLDGEVFVDLGACDGMSTVQFMQWCHGNGFSYCFEPDGKNIDTLKQNMKRKGLSEGVDYCLVSKGAWCEQTDLLFLESGTADSHFITSEESNMNAIRIPVTALDNELEGKKVTFIKMDIEGSELEALRGAERIIREQKPKLAICVYHKPEDIWEIPEYIISLRDDYQLFFRHYSFGGTETVLYAI